MANVLLRGKVEGRASHGFNYLWDLTYKKRGKYDTLNILYR